MKRRRCDMKAKNLTLSQRWELKEAIEQLQKADNIYKHPVRTKIGLFEGYSPAEITSLDNYAVLVGVQQSAIEIALRCLYNTLYEEGKNK